ncbi:MAG: hypothetical protein QOF09_473 [Alphaproteobacteria bacterium]|jgi:hypothetical protein|nr:hypothetical protein [Alphaproteobacteria bacterium]
MEQTTNSTQVYSPFGSGYVPEDHDPDLVNGPEPSPRKRAVLFLVSALALSTAAGAIAATTWNRMNSPEQVWTQEAPSSVLKLPGGFGVDDAIY